MKNILRSLCICLYFSGAASAQSLQWGTYLGGLNREYGTAVCTDKWGNIYMVGNTASTLGIATPGSHQASYGGDGGGNTSSFPGDAFISKYNPAGILQWATYLGGNDDDAATGIGCDTTGRIYVCGWTRSNNGIATGGSHQPTYGGGDDGFLACFDSAGQRLWSTYYGGSGDENGLLVGSLFVAPNGDSYLTGKTTSSNNMATPLAHQPTLSLGGTDAYIAKFNRNGQRLWGTYYGSGAIYGQETEGVGICVEGNALYITGSTLSTAGIATTGAHQLAYGGGISDAFLTRFDTSGTLQWGTYLGGTDYDKGTAILANNGNLYISGMTKSLSHISTTGSHQPVFGGNQDLFLGCFSPSGTRIWSTYFGGSILDASGRFMAKDALGNIYLTGYTTSDNDIATINAIRPTRAGSQDVIIAKFNSSGARQWASYYGGTGQDNGLGMAVGKNGMLYISGRTASATGISTAGSQQHLLGGNNDAFLIAINDCAPISSPDTIIGRLSLCANSRSTFRVNPVAGALSYTWILPLGWSGTSSSDSITITTDLSPGSLKVIANSLCGHSDTQQISIAVNPVPIISPSNPSICNGDSITLNASNSTGTLQWLFNHAAIGGAVTNAITVRQAGSYTVVATNGNCTDTAVAAALTVNPLPIVPNIIKTGQVLSLPISFASYQWNFNGAPITGARASTFTYSIDGSYTVTVTDANGCSSDSDPLNTNGSSVPSQLRGSILVYPNPLVGRQVNISTDAARKVLICSVDGRTVSQHILGRGINTIDVSGLSSGIYFIRIQDQNDSFMSQHKLTIL